MTTPQQQAAAKQAAINQQVRTQFRVFIESPMAKMMLSLVPPNEQHPDLLISLLEAMFQAGADAGVGVGHGGTAFLHPEQEGLT